VLLASRIRMSSRLNGMMSCTTKQRENGDAASINIQVSSDQTHQQTSAKVTKCDGKAKREHRFRSRNISTSETRSQTNVASAAQRDNPEAQARTCRAQAQLQAPTHTRTHTRAHLYVHDNVLARRAHAQRQACARGPTCARARVQPARRAGGWRPGARTAKQTNEGFCPEKCTAGRIQWTDVWAGKRRAGGSAAGRCPRNGAQERCVGFCCQSTHGHFVTGTASIHSRW